MLDMFAAIPDAAVLPRDAQKAPAAFTAIMRLWLGPLCRNNPISRVFAQLGNKR